MIHLRVNLKLEINLKGAQNRFIGAEMMACKTHSVRN